MAASSSLSSLRDLLKDPSSPKPKSIYGFPPKNNDAVSDSDDVSLEGNVSDTNPSLSEDEVLVLSSYNDNGGGVTVRRMSTATGLAVKPKLPPPPINCLKMVTEGKHYVYACIDNSDRSTREAVTIPHGDLLCANRGSGSLKLYFNNDRRRSDGVKKQQHKENGNSSSSN